MNRALLVSICLTLIACGDDSTIEDSGAYDGATSDAGAGDGAVVSRDGAVDASAPAVDGSNPRDSAAGDAADAISPDSGSSALVLETRQAFPSAMGAGSIATGGRGGRVIHVTNLNDSGAGSFREAVRASGPRTVVFDVSGRVHLETTITLWEEHSDLTIAGETAPEGGITISGRPLQLSTGYTHNVIIRHIRFRNGSYTGASDVFEHNGITSNGTEGFIFDHMSFSFCDDQAISMDGRFAPLRDGTIQRSTFSENATGIIIGLSNEFPIERLSTLNNLFVHQSHRTPNIGGSGRFDVANNVLFNWHSRLTNINSFSPELNYIANHLTPGSFSSTANRVQNATPSIFTANNFHPELYPTPALDDQGIWSSFNDGSTLPGHHFTTTQHPLLAATTLLSAAEARADVLANVGANSFVDEGGVVGRYLDTYDIERINDVRTGTSRDPFNKSWTQPVLPNNERSGSFYDTLADLPAFFVAAHGVTSNDEVLATYDFGALRVDNPAGYTALEMYLAYAAGDFAH